MKVYKVSNPSLHNFVLRLNKVLPFSEYRVIDENLNILVRGYKVEELFYVLEEVYAKKNGDEKDSDWRLFNDKEYTKLADIPFKWLPPSNTWGGWSSSPLERQQSTEPEPKEKNKYNHNRKDSWW